MDLAIDVADVTKQFGDKKALQGLSFQAPRGRTLAVLGPNGAGKSTTVNILSTRTPPSSGKARVLGLDVVADRAALRRKIAVVRQDACVDGFLNGRENLVVAAGLSGVPTAEARDRADRLLQRFDLVSAAGRRLEHYSGGMRRRLDLAVGLISQPALLFLDEPTTGLDPVSRQALWEIIREIVAQGTDLILTTQYLDEADALADDIVLVADGRVLAQGTPSEMKALVGRNEHVEIVVLDAANHRRAASILAAHGALDVQIDVQRARLTARNVAGPAALVPILTGLELDGIDVEEVQIRRPTLDEAFHTLTTGTATAASTGPELAMGGTR